MKKTLLLISAVLALIVAGCAGGDTPYAPIIGGGGGGGGGIAFSLGNNGPIFVSPGNTATFTINVNGQQAPAPGRTEDNVALSLATALPEGATAAFANASVPVGGSTTLAITTTNATPIGSYDLTVNGTNSTGTHSTVVTVHVNGGDFIITMTPDTRSIDNGGVIQTEAEGDPFVEYTVSVVKENDIMVGPVQLTITGPTATTNGQPIFETLATPTTLTFTASDTGPKTATIRLTRIRTSNVQGTFPFTVSAHLETITKGANASVVLTGQDGS